MRVALIGTGLIGGSIGLALKTAADVTIVAFDKDVTAARRAVERGAADEAAASPADAAHGADFVFVATPVGAIADSVRLIAEAVEPTTVITDVGSTKSRVLLEVGQVLGESSHFVGGHPMAGTEQEGIDAASPGLFSGAWWILTPTEATDPAAYQRLHGLLTTLRARIMALTPDEHDRLMAVISHVPQLTATTLMNMAARRGEEHAGLLALAAGGFRDVTRVAASNPEIWLDVCRQNGEAIAATLKEFAEELLTLRELIVAGEDAPLRDALLRAREARRSLPGKEVRDVPFEVVMPVPDRPGVLADVTTTIGNLGINIEDLQITHSSEGGRGVLHLTIAGRAQAGSVAAALEALGFEVRTLEL